MNLQLLDLNAGIRPCLGKAELDYIDPRSQAPGVEDIVQSQQFLIRIDLVAGCLSRIRLWFGGKDLGILPLWIPLA